MQCHVAQRNLVKRKSQERQVKQWNIKMSLIDHLTEPVHPRQCIFVTNCELNSPGDNYESSCFKAVCTYRYQTWTLPECLCSRSRRWKCVSNKRVCGSDLSHFLLTSKFNPDTGQFFSFFCRCTSWKSHISKKALLVSNRVSQHPLWLLTWFRKEVPQAAMQWKALK